MRFISLVVITSLALTGCSQIPTEQSNPDEPSTEQQTETESSELDAVDPGDGEEVVPSDEQSANAPDATDDFQAGAGQYVAIETLEEAAVIAANTWERFEQQGVVETRADANLVLVYNPDQKDEYSAAVFNTAENTSELVFDTRGFTSAWAFLLLSEPEMIQDTYFGTHPAGFTLEYDDPSFGRFGFNYLTDGEVMVGAWFEQVPGNPDSVAIITYDFEVQQQWKDRLDVAVEEFLAEQPTE
jgi:hypothetical protein